MKKSFVLFVSLLVFFVSCTNNQPISPRVNHVMLQVSDMDASVHFYTAIFDLEKTNTIKKIAYSDENGDFKEIERHLVFLKFPGQDFVYELLENKQLDSVSGAGRFAHVGFDVKNIEIPFEKAVNLGAEILVPIRTVKAGGIEAKQAFFKGPDGEFVELMEMISGEF